MTFDVIVPSKNRQNDIFSLIDSIILSTKKPTRIIVVDQSDEAYDFSKYTGTDIEILHLFNPNISGASVARNIGISYSKAEYVYIFDDDIIIDPDFFEIILGHFSEHPDVVGICGRQKNSRSSKFKVACFSLFHRGEFRDERKKYNSGLIKPGIYPVSKLSGGIVAFKRNVLLEIKFDPIYIRGSLGEDRDLSYRVHKKYNLMFATDALALHNHSKVGRYDPKEEFACKIASYSLFYIKNIEKTIYNSFCYRLVLIGVWLDALIFSIKHKTLLSIKGVIKGYKYKKHHFVGVPFIDSNIYKDRFLS